MAVRAPRPGRAFLSTGRPDLDDFLERPAISFDRRPLPEFALVPGDVLGGRFRIVGPRGYGGMGEVYEAEDLELSTRVALKTIRSEIADNPAAIERFRTEVLQARSVSHPNVCRVFDLFSEEGPSGTVRFLTMELVEGETLSQRLERAGPLSLSETLDIARQVAAALGAAHARGVIHRDLKPGNVMLASGSSGPRVVVTDFGIAHPWTAGGAAGLPGDRYVGTPGYVAPEVEQGRPIEPAADVFSFGVLVHQLLTDRLPQTPPGGDRPSADRRLPHSWREAIDWCLQRDPTQRPRSLRVVVQQASGESRRRRVRAAVTMAAASALLAMALFEPLSRYLRRIPTLGPDPSILMGPVENVTGEVDLDGVSQLMKRQLEQSPSLRLMEDAEVAQILKTMAQSPDAELTLPRAREVVWRAGAAAFASGTLRRAGNAYALTVRLEARGPQPDVVGRNWSRSYEARDRSELLSRVREGANWIRVAGGEAVAEMPRFDRPVGEVTTSSWKALHLYTRAESMLAQSRPEDALALLEEATREDPDFALAWMRKGDVFMSRRQLDQGYRHWERAMAVMRRRNLGTREEYRIRGMFASDTHDFAEAERVYRLYLLSYPNDFRPYFYIARPLLMLGRTGEAIIMLEQARALNPSEWSITAQIAMAKLRAGRLEEVPAELATLESLGQKEWALCIRAQFAFRTDDFLGAMAGFRSLEDASVAALRRRASALQAALLADLGETAEAAARLAAGAASDAATGSVEARADKLIALAVLSLRQNRRSVVRDLGIQIEQLDRSPLRLAAVGSLHARAGAVGDAERLLQAVPETSPSRQLQIQRRRLSAEIALARRDAAGAWRQFQEAAALEAPGVLPEYLARGAAAAGEYGTALALYRRMAEDQGYYWRYPDNEPGQWFTALTEYLRIARQLSVTPDPALVERHQRMRAHTLQMHLDKE